MSRCDDCRFDWQMPAGEVSPHLASRVPRYREVVSSESGGLLADRAMRTRPSEGVWSPLEYLAHMRDVAEFYGDRINRVLTEDRPVLHVRTRFARLAELRDYRNDDPATVLLAFEDNADALRRSLGGLEQRKWSRIGIGSEGDERTLLDLARRFAHEVHHHLLDIEQQATLETRP